MKELLQDQSQSILDNYSLGKVITILPLAAVLVSSEKEINLSRCLVETNQGLYIIAFAPNNELHSLWWSSEAKNFAIILSKALKLKNAKVLLTSQDTITVHKFDLRVSVFAL